VVARKEGEGEKIGRKGRRGRKRETLNDVPQTLANMAGLYERLSNSEKAMECAQRALKIFEEEFGVDDFHLCPVLVSIGRIHMTAQQFPEAKKMFKRALAISESKLGK
jgi:tetratricopeptide (TPR) repeat protein